MRIMTARKWQARAQDETYKRTACMEIEVPAEYRDKVLEIFILANVAKNYLSNLRR